MTWVMCGAGMLAGWCLAPYAVWLMCLAAPGSAGARLPAVVRELVGQSD